MKFRLTTGTGKTFIVEEESMEIANNKWFGESMIYGNGSSQVIGIEVIHPQINKFTPKPIKFGVILYDKNKNLNISITALSVTHCKEQLESFFGGYLPAYDIILRGKIVFQCAGPNRVRVKI